MNDFETSENLGLVFITSDNTGGVGELIEGWEDFNKLEEHEYDKNSIDDFITWFNESYITQIERIFIEEIIL